ncbi:MAG: tRNA (adenosine(37)-N6)-dimethylallyltransferase MiaA [Oscillospiraceae bacterium]|nr:tRNA (adenosine(37)-N6)-dimethylallyltransferase MiaA [Oscillospiraceae bacterium]
MAGYSGDKISLLVVAGPTASGKTAAAIEAARLLGGEIVSADSMQIYRGLDIGTAKPTPPQLAAVPHHMIDIRDPQDAYSAADYARDANAAIDGILSRGHVPIVCGGTGFYIEALVSGVEFAAQPDGGALREQVRGDWEQRGTQAMLGELAGADPEYARTLHPNNVKRILRAVEKLRATGMTQAQLAEASHRAESRFRCHYAVLSPPRDTLYARIDARAGEMLRAGLLGEARYVYDNRDRFATARDAIGYKEFFGYFSGEQTLEECADALRQASRRYAKRQLTWFRRVRGAVWYEAADKMPQALAQELADGFRRIAER